MYYKQKPRPKPVANDARKSIQNRVMDQYRSLGWNGATSADVQRRARDIKFIADAQARRNVALGVKANKFQPHFRNQVMF